MEPIGQFDEFAIKSGRITKMRWSRKGSLLAVPTESGSVVLLDIEARVARTLGRHSAGVTTVAWDRKDECILTGSLDRSVGLWEVSTGTRAPFTVQAHKTPVHSIEWTDEEAFAVTCSHDHVRVLDGSCLLSGWSKEMENRLNTHRGFEAASCSYQSTFLLGIAAYSGTLLILASLVSGDVLATVRVPQPVGCLAWSPVEDLLAAAIGDGILLFRANQEGFDGSPRRLAVPMTSVGALAFCGDGRILASRDDQGLKFWDVKAERLITALSQHGENPFAPHSGIAFHPDRLLLAASMTPENSLRILDVGCLAAVGDN